MEASLISLFPGAKETIDGFKVPLDTGDELAKLGTKSIEIGADLFKKTLDIGISSLKNFTPANSFGPSLTQFLEIYKEGFNNLLEINSKSSTQALAKLRNEIKAKRDFIDFITEDIPKPDWHSPYTKKDVLLDLPGMRLIDLSTKGPHKIENYSVVFAPRAGHHSNIAENTAIYLRDHGLSKMAIVEQKCASEIPLNINGKRHYEDFESQVRQFKAILELLKNKTGLPSHLIAVCQPGPLLITTLILYPELGKTFGSAGSPMHTEGEPGMLTDFSRMMGEDYIDRLIDLFSKTIPDGEGKGRKIYDGRLQVLGFYHLGMDQHIRNFKKYYSDLKNGNTEAAERQKNFYHWYNWAHHFPAGFIRDTYKKIFVNNDLIHGRMKIGNKTVGIKDYPGNVPVWSLGGLKDDIVPPKQANGHLDEIDSVPKENKLSLLAEAGHMGLFRSSKVLKNDYSKVVTFILKHSDKKAKK